MWCLLSSTFLLGQFSGIPLSNPLSSLTVRWCRSSQGDPSWSGCRSRRECLHTPGRAAGCPWTTLWGHLLCIDGIWSIQEGHTLEFLKEKRNISLWCVWSVQLAEHSRPHSFKIQVPWPEIIVGNFHSLVCEERWTQSINRPAWAFSESPAPMTNSKHIFQWTCQNPASDCLRKIFHSCFRVNVC